LSVTQLNDWQSKFGDGIDFLTVYIAEAHANDVWPLGTHVDLPSHKTFEDRINASDILINKYGLKIPVLYDTMDDTFDNLYAVWPERYYIVCDGLIDVVFSPTVDFGFDRETMERALTIRHPQYLNQL